LAPKRRLNFLKNKPTKEKIGEIDLHALNYHPIYILFIKENIAIFGREGIYKCCTIILWVEISSKIEDICSHYKGFFCERLDVASLSISQKNT